jgi:hypothetical protein
MPIHDWSRVYAGLFHHFHQSWTIRLTDALNAGLLPRGMTALVEQKAGPRESDVLTVDWLGEHAREPISSGTVTLPPPATRIVRKSSKEFYAEKANRIVVRYALGQMVAVIEIVSPGNKDSNRRFREFVDKSVNFIRQGIHLLVVDLFPPTKRDPFGVHRSIWEEFEDEDEEFEFPPGKNLILASYNAGPEKAAYVEPVAPGDLLEDMALFLIDEYYISVPLEATYQATWQALPREMQEYVETGRPPGAPR